MRDKEIEGITAIDLSSCQITENPYFYNMNEQDSRKSQSLSEVKKRLEAIIDTALDGIITIDEFGVIESINKAGAEIFEYDEEELIGQNVKILMTSPHKNRHDSYIHNYLNTGETRIIGTKREETGRKKDGTLFPIRLAVSEISLDDRRIFTGIIHDLTEEKKGEDAIIRINMELENRVASQTFELKMAVEKLMESNKMLEQEIKNKNRIEQKLRKSRAELELALEKERELNEMKSRFVSMTSHEFRTPLSTIYSSANIIDRYQEKEHQNNRTRHTKKIKKSVTLLISILDEFLNLSRLEKDVVMVKKDNEAYSLLDFCREISDELESILKNGQSIQLNIEDDILLRLDPSILKQILYNILSNAIKYSGENSEIMIRGELKGNALNIEVKDEGIGIPKSDQKHLFTRFFRASNSGHIQGTGLGLNLVLHYLNLLNGKISFESEEHKGSSFIVEIPL